MILLSGCAKDKYALESGVTNPAFPSPHNNVSSELQKNCYPRSKCPAIWDWLDKLYKLKDQLEN